MTDIASLENQAEKLRDAIEARRLALKLFANREFKKLILEQFCGTEAARYAQLSGDPALSEVDRADALAIAQASGHLKRYLSVVCRMGDVAERDLASTQEAIAEMRQEADDIYDDEGEV